MSGAGRAPGGDSGRERSAAEPGTAAGAARRITALGGSRRIRREGQRERDLSAFQILRHYGPFVIFCWIVQDFACHNRGSSVTKER